MKLEKPLRQNAQTKAEELLAEAVFAMQKNSHALVPKDTIRIRICPVSERYFRWMILRNDRTVIESSANQHSRSMKEAIQSVAEVLAIGAQVENILVEVL